MHTYLTATQHIAAELVVGVFVAIFLYNATVCALALVRSPAKNIYGRIGVAIELVILATLPFLARIVMGA